MPVIRIRYEGPSVNLEHIRAFLAVAELKSFSKAAAALGCSQPAVSRQVKAFEEQVGSRVLLRDRNSLSITPDGQRLLESLTPLYEQLTRALAPNARSDEPEGDLRLGALSELDPLLA